MLKTGDFDESHANGENKVLVFPSVRDSFMAYDSRAGRGI